MHQIGIRSLCRLADKLQDTIEKDRSIHRVQMNFTVELEREYLEYLIDKVTTEIMERQRGTEV